jgi:uncharacterized protein YfaS (alpha-2-macroglobulin family)
VTGTTSVTLADAKLTLNWSTNTLGGTEYFSWPGVGVYKLNVDHSGQGHPWALVSTSSAVPLKAERFSGFSVTKEIKPFRQAIAGVWSKGDVAEIRLKIKAQTETTTVALMDPIPAGAKILGSGDSQNQASVYADYEELGADAYRAYYGYVPASEIVVVYRLQVNNSGTFNLPATLVEAVYSPEMFGETPNASWTIKP